ncbi:class I lanthipeptide [Pedobacter sp. KLB.chiD]|uniref:class I lanthipeptide n=1 Tax=Pedobacter sp. KLB.chiD TaxID=3387402 RepID=UPI00399A2FD0
MKKQPKIKLSLAKETIAKLNEEQMELIAGGQGPAANAQVTVKTEVDLAGDVGNCGTQTVQVSKTCPATSSCLCVCE